MAEGATLTWDDVTELPSPTEQAEAELADVSWDEVTEAPTWREQLKIEERTDKWQRAIERNRKKYHAPSADRTIRYIGKSLPFVGSMVKTIESKVFQESAKRMREGKESDKDREIVADAVAQAELAAERKELWDKGDPGEMARGVMDIAASLPAYAVEIKATGGFYELAKQATPKIGGAAGQAVLPRLAGVAAQTAANPTRVMATSEQIREPGFQITKKDTEYLDQLASFEEPGAVQAYVRGYLSTMSEFGSERAGGHLMKLGGKAVPQGIKDTVSGLARRWKLSGSKLPFGKWLQAAGYHGPIAESLEERVNEPIQYVLGTGDGGVLGSLAQGDISSAGKQLIQEQAAFALPAVGQRALAIPEGRRRAVELRDLKTEQGERRLNEHREREFMLEPDAVSNWVTANPAQAAQLAALDQPSRAQWTELGPKGLKADAPYRAQFAAALKAHLASQTPQESTPAARGPEAAPQPESVPAGEPVAQEAVPEAATELLGAQDAGHLTAPNGTESSPQTVEQILAGEPAPEQAVERPLELTPSPTPGPAQPAMLDTPQPQVAPTPGVEFVEPTVQEPVAPPVPTKGLKPEFAYAKQHGHTPVPRQKAHAKTRAKQASDRLDSFGIAHTFVEGDTAFTDPSTRHVYLGVDSLNTPEADRIVGDEIMHSLGLDTREDLVTPEEIAWAEQDYLARNEKAGGKYKAYADQLRADPARLRKEAIAHLGGRAFMNPDFRAQLEREQPSLLQKIIDAILEFFGAKQGELSASEKKLLEELLAAKERIAKADDLDSLDKKALHAEAKKHGIPSVGLKQSVIKDRIRAAREKVAKETQDIVQAAESVDTEEVARQAREMGFDVESGEPPVETAPEPVAEKASSWLDSLDEQTRERVFAEMRRLQEKSDYHAEKERSLRPKQGHVGFGSADMDEFFKQEAYGNFLRGVRNGMTPQAAADYAKEEVRKAVKSWNEKGVKGRVSANSKYELQRWEGTGDTTIENAMRSLLRASEPVAEKGEPPQETGLVRLEGFERTTPAPGTPARELLDAEWKAYNDGYDSLGTKLDKAKEDHEKLKYGSVKKAKAKEKVEKLQDEKYEFDRKHEDLAKRWRVAHAEDLVEQATDEANRIAAVALLNDRLAESGIKERVPGGEKSYERIKALIRAEAEKQGASPEEAEILESDLGGFILSFPSKKKEDSVAFRVMRRLETYRLEKTAREADAELDGMENVPRDAKRDFRSRIDSHKHNPEIVEQTIAAARKMESENAGIKSKAEQAAREQNEGNIKRRSEGAVPLSKVPVRINEALSEDLLPEDGDYYSNGRVIIHVPSLSASGMKDLDARGRSERQMKPERAATLVKEWMTDAKPESELEFVGAVPHQYNDGTASKPKWKTGYHAYFITPDGTQYATPAEVLQWLAKNGASFDKAQLVKAGTVDAILLSNAGKIFALSTVLENQGEINPDVVRKKSGIETPAPKKGRKKPPSDTPAYQNPPPLAGKEERIRSALQDEFGAEQKQTPDAPKTLREKAAQKSAQTAEELKAAAEELKAAFRPPLGAVFDPQREAANLDRQIKAAARFAKAAINHGHSKFSEYVALVAEQIGYDGTVSIGDVLTDTWNTLRQRTGFEHLDEAGDVLDVLEKPAPTPEQIEQAAEEPMLPDGDDLTSIKKAVVNDLRAMVGLPEMQGSTPQTVEEWAEQARVTLAADPKAAIRLVNQLAGKSARPINQHDAMLLQFRYRQLANELKPTVDAYFEAVQEGDPVAIATAKTAVINARKAMTDFEEIIHPSKETWGRAGVALQQMMRQDFSLEAILRRGQEANDGQELSPEQVAELTAMAKQLEDLQKKLDEQRAKLDAIEAELASKKQHTETVNESKRRKTARKSERRAAAEKKVADAWSEFQKATVGRAGAGIPLDLLPPAVKVAKAYIELGYVRFGEFMAGVRSHIKDPDEQLFRQAWEQAKLEEGVVEQELDPADIAELSKVARQIQRTLVEAGMTDRDQVIDAVHEILQADIPGFTRRQTMDALSRYGQFQVQSQEEIDRLLRDMNSEILKLSQIDQLEKAMQRVEALRKQGKSDEEIGDILANEKLLVEATGLVRDKPTQTVRNLTKKYNELKKSIPATTEDRAGLLQTAAASIERALTNRIADLTWEIDHGARIVKENRERPTNERIKELEAERDRLRAIHREMFPVVKTPLTDEQRLAIAVRAADKAIAQLEKQLADRDFDHDPKRAPVSSPELAAKRARLEQLRAARKAAKEVELARWEGEGGGTGQVAPASREAIARRVYEASLRKRIAGYQQILADGDFAPKPKKEARPLSAEELKLKRELQDMRHKVLQKYAEYHLAHLHGIAWGVDKVAELAHLSRALMTSFDLSALLRQGGLAAMGHPILAKRALFETIASIARSYSSANAKALLDGVTVENAEKFLQTIDSRQAEFNLMHTLTEGPAGEFRLRAGLNLPSSDEKITRQEEAFQGRWGKRVPGIAISGRLYTMILNKMRADLFDLMVQNLGRGGQVSIEEAKIIAGFVNVATGRSNFGSLNGWAVALNTVFFAPRYVASRFQYLAMPFYLPFQGGIKANWRVKRAIYKEYARTVAGIGTVLGAFALLGLLYDDDDDDKPKIEIDPRSADFLKVRIGETRLDFLAGLSQVIVYSTRFAVGSTKSSTGKVRQFGEGYKPETRLTLSWKFARTKFAPVPGAVATVADDWTNVVGRKETPLSLAAGSVTALSLREVPATMKAQGVPKGTAFSLLSILGVGVNTYGPKTQYLMGTEAERKAQIEKDLERFSMDDPILPPYSEFLTDEQLAEFRDQAVATVAKKAAASYPLSITDKEKKEEITLKMKQDKWRADVTRAADWLRQHNITPLQAVRSHKGSADAKRNIRRRLAGQLPS